MLDECAVLNHSVVSDSLRPHVLYSPPVSSVHVNFPGKNTEVVYHFLLRGMFATQGCWVHRYLQLLVFLLD